MDHTDPDKVPIRVLNPTLKPITVKKKTAIGTVSPVMACEVVREKENEEQTKKEEFRVPVHLNELYEASVVELPPDQHIKVAKLLKPEFVITHC